LRSTTSAAAGSFGYVAWVTSCAGLLTILLIVLGLFLLGASVNGFEEQEPAARAASRREMMDTLRHLLITMDRKTARTALQRIVDRDPDFPEAVFNLALLAESDGESGIAATLYGRVLTLARSEGLKEQARDGLRRLPKMGSDGAAAGAGVSASTGAGTDLAQRYAQAVGQSLAFKQAGLMTFAAARGMDAIAIAPQRWEAYAAAGDALWAMQELDRAREMLTLASQHATPGAKERLQRELTALAGDAACASAMKTATDLHRRQDYLGAGTVLAQAWRERCPGRDAIGLAAAAEFIQAGIPARAEPLLKSLSTSRDGATITRVDKLSRRASKSHRAPLLPREP
jgi:hypothetical protein